MFRNDGPRLAALIRQGLSSTRGGYELLAPRFDATPFKTPDALAQTVVGRAVEVAGRPPMRALDLCCGTGAGVRALQGVATERVVGIDFSTAMLSRLTALEAPAAPVRLIEADVLTAPLAAEFDLVTCFGALGHIAPADQPRFAAQIASSLRSGGTFAFVSLLEVPKRHPVTFAARVFNGAMRARNLLRRPRFVMYYLTFLMPRATELFEAEGLAVSWTPLETSVPGSVIGLATRP